ncbi:MAG: TlpA family protein disulfide reductase [Acidobacteria bacterium]|nr:TlpA family protein disulfide reductase [Acidobacteriota bacterium]
MKWLSSMFGGRKMAALEAGVQAPQFELPAMDGTGFSLEKALKRGPVLAVFFKISCPVCQYALPYFERLYKAYGTGKVSMVGVSQNDKRETAEFLKRYGVTFPVLLDDTRRFPASNAYALTNVPTVFWIAEDREIEVSSVGWVRKDIEEIAQKAAAAGDEAPKTLFEPSEQIPDFRAG